MTNRIKKSIEQGKIRGAKALLSEYYNNEHKASWIKVIKDEYDLLFPSTRVMTNDEYEKTYEDIDKIYDENDDRILNDTIAIDYSDNEDYLPWNDYLNQTIVVDEETGETEPKFIYIPLSNDELTAKIDSYQPLQDKLKTISNLDKQEQINRITVTINDKILYADPISRTDIADVITLMIANDLDEYLWKTTTGVQTVTLDEFKEALYLGLKAKGDIIGVSDDQ